MTDCGDTPKQTKPDQISHTCKTDTTVSLSHDDPVQASLVPRFCQCLCVFGCTNCNGHDSMIMLQTKQDEPYCNLTMIYTAGPVIRVPNSLV